jgi:hypothetical protein
MKYKIIVSHSGEELSRKVTEHIQEGWEPIGSHQVHVRHSQNRYRGTQHIDTLNDLEYSQTMLKKELDKLEN